MLVALRSLPISSRDIPLLSRADGLPGIATEAARNQSRRTGLVRQSCSCAGQCRVDCAGRFWRERQPALGPHYFWRCWFAAWWSGCEKLSETAVGQARLDVFSHDAIFECLCRNGHRFFRRQFPVPALFLALALADDIGRCWDNDMAEALRQKICDQGSIA